MKSTTIVEATVDCKMFVKYRKSEIDARASIFSKVLRHGLLFRVVLDLDLDLLLSSALSPRWRIQEYGRLQKVQH